MTRPSLAGSEQSQAIDAARSMPCELFRFQRAGGLPRYREAASPKGWHCVSRKRRAAHCSCANSTDGEPALRKELYAHWVNNGL